MPRKPASRKYQLTINNPKEKGYTHQKIVETLNEFSNLIYWCMCDEIGEQLTYHTHIFFISKNPIMFDTVKNRFYSCHIEKTYGTNTDNYNYIRKIGDKFADKKETNLPDTFEEFGELPPDREKKNTVNEEIYFMIKNGCSNYEILEQIPSAINKIDYINKTREIINQEENKSKIRNLTVTYLWGEAGSGKTRYVMDKHGYENVYRVTNYKHPFDGYKGQKIILFEEFRSSLEIKDMLNYLDIYPLELPCRYADKVALYDTVYIATNIPLNKQYEPVQIYEAETWNAFLRRIHEVKEIKKTTNPNLEHQDFEDIE